MSTNYTPTHRRTISRTIKPTRRGYEQTIYNRKTKQLSKELLPYPINTPWQEVLRQEELKHPEDAVGCLVGFAPFFKL